MSGLAFDFEPRSLALGKEGLGIESIGQVDKVFGVTLPSRASSPVRQLSLPQATVIYH